MNVLVVGFVLLATLLIMELFSWFIHKYLFHGPLWRIHRTHHDHQKDAFFELNDIFSLLFALLSWCLMYKGFANKGILFWIGCGISLYGIIYFILHDWLIHARFKSLKISNRYLKGIIRAHKIHHKHLNKFPSEEFGLLFVSKKHFKK